MRKNQKVKDQANKGLNRSNSAKIGLKFRLQKAY